MMPLKNQVCEIDGCGRFIQSAAGRKVHLKMYHNLPTICPIEDCNRQYRLMQLVEHLGRAHMKSEMVCRFCKATMTTDDFIYHMKVCTSAIAPTNHLPKILANRANLTIEAREVRRKNSCKYCHEVVFVDEMLQHLRNCKKRRSYIDNNSNNKVNNLPTFNPNPEKKLVVFEMPKVNLANVAPGTSVLKRSFALNNPVVLESQPKKKPNTQTFAVCKPTIPKPQVLELPRSQSKPNASIPIQPKVLELPKSKPKFDSITVSNSETEESQVIELSNNGSNSGIFVRNVFNKVVNNALILNTRPEPRKSSIVPLTGAKLNALKRAYAQSGCDKEVPNKKLMTDDFPDDVQPVVQIKTLKDQSILIEMRENAPADKRDKQVKSFRIGNRMVLIDEPLVHEDPTPIFDPVESSDFEYSELIQEAAKEKESNSSVFSTNKNTQVLMPKDVKEQFAEEFSQPKIKQEPPEVEIIEPQDTDVEIIEPKQEPKNFESSAEEVQIIEPKKEPEYFESHLEEVAIIEPKKEPKNFESIIDNDLIEDDIEIKEEFDKDWCELSREQLTDNLMRNEEEWGEFNGEQLLDKLLRKEMSQKDHLPERDSDSESEYYGDFVMSSDVESENENEKEKDKEKTKEEEKKVVQEKVPRVVKKIVEKEKKGKEKMKVQKPQKKPRKMRRRRRRGKRWTVRKGAQALRKKEREMEQLLEEGEGEENEEEYENESQMEEDEQGSEDEQIQGQEAEDVREQEKEDERAKDVEEDQKIEEQEKDNEIEQRAQEEEEMQEKDNEIEQRAQEEEEMQEKEDEMENIPEKVQEIKQDQKVADEEEDEHEIEQENEVEMEREEENKRDMEEEHQKEHEEEKEPEREHEVEQEVEQEAEQEPEKEAEVEKERESIQKVAEESEEKLETNQELENAVVNDKQNEAHEIEQKQESEVEQEEVQNEVQKNDQENVPIEEREKSQEKPEEMEVDQETRLENIQDQEQETRNENVQEMEQETDSYIFPGIEQEHEKAKEMKQSSEVSRIEEKQETVQDLEEEKGNRQEKEPVIEIAAELLNDELPKELEAEISYTQILEERREVPDFYPSETVVSIDDLPLCPLELIEPIEKLTLDTQVSIGSFSIGEVPVMEDKTEEPEEKVEQLDEKVEELEKKVESEKVEENELKQEFPRKKRGRKKGKFRTKLKKHFQQQDRVRTRLSARMQKEFDLTNVKKEKPTLNAGKKKMNIVYPPNEDHRLLQKQIHDVIKKELEEVRANAHDESNSEISGNILVTCPFKNCLKRFKSAYLYQHVKVVHHKVKPRCTHCNKEVVPSHLRQHERICSSDGQKPFKCRDEKCVATFRTFREINQHVWHVHRRPVPCPIKGCESMVKPAGLKKHIRSVHENIQGECDNCGKSFKKKYLPQHIKVCTTTMEKKFSCTIQGCNALFRMHHEIKAHIWRVHRDPIPCPFEGCSVTVNPVRLERHIKFIHDKMRVRCNMCGKEVMESSLPCHAKSCTGESKYKCTVKGCKEVFKFSLERSQHVNEVHAMAHKCPHPGCNKLFLKSTVLTHHIKVIHEKPLEICNYCNKEIRSSYLYKHKKLCVVTKQEG